MTKPRGANSGIALALFFFLVTVLTVLGFLVKEWRPPVASKHGAGVDTVITYLLITTGVFFIVGHVVLGCFVWRYSKEENARYQPLSRKTEWIWALIPVIVMAVVSEVGVLLMGLPVWAEIYGEPPQDALQVEVVGKQFEWFVRYPGKDGKFGRTLPKLVHESRNFVGLDEDDPNAKDDIIKRGALHLPVGRSVYVRLRSHDVLHSFAIPAFRVKQDIVPGFTGYTQFQPVKTGMYEIACAELCGFGHYEMKGLVYVKSAEEFDKWLSSEVGWFEE